MAFPCDVVVTTCKSYAPTTIPAFLETFRHCGVPTAALKIVVGQCDGQHECDALSRLESEGVTVVTVPYGVEALTGVVAVANGELATTPWFVYVQDSCLVGPDFATRVAQVLKHADEPRFDVVKLLDTFSLSVGMYRSEWVKSKAADLNAHRIFAFDTDSMRRMKMHIEDKAFQMADPARTLVLGRFSDPKDRLLVGEFRYPGSATRREVEHYPSLDLYKLKSWMGQSVPKYRTHQGDEVLAIPLGP